MRVVRASAWFLLMLVGSIAVAGLVISIDHPPSGDGRPELSAREAAILAPRLASLDPALGRLAAAAQGLSASGRDVLVALRSLDLPAATAALGWGEVMLREVAAAAALVEAGTPGLLVGLGGDQRLPAAERARLAAIAAVAGTDDRLARAWADVDRAAAAPIELLTAVRAHEDAVERAAAHGRAERWAPALSVLEEASVAVSAVERVREEAAVAGRGVAAVEDLLARLRRHDAALTTLYAELEASGGVRTPAVDTALAEVTTTQSASAEHPDAVGAAIMEVGGSDITSSLLTIDEVRGVIEGALAPGDAR